MAEHDLEPRNDGRCEFPGCDHPDAQYMIAVETLHLDGRREAIACRQHVALVAKALGEELRAWIREGVELAEMDELEEQRAVTRAREG